MGLFLKKKIKKTKYAWLGGLLIFVPALATIYVSGGGSDYSKLLDKLRSDKNLELREHSKVITRGYEIAQAEAMCNIEVRYSDRKSVV